MITHLSGGAFDLRTGRPWTCGLSPSRDKEKFNLEWKNNESSRQGRWYFEIDSVQYSAKQVVPYLKDIQMHTENCF